MSSDLLWGLVRKTNSFLVKARNHGGVRFSTERGNLLNVHSFKSSGLANCRTLDVKSAGERGVVLTVKSGVCRKPAKAFRSVSLTRDVRRACRSAKNTVSARKYRVDLKAALLARVSAEYRV